jgi:hypothetical protein
VAAGRLGDAREAIHQARRIDPNAKEPKRLEVRVKRMAAHVGAVEDNLNLAVLARVLTRLAWARAQPVIDLGPTSGSRNSSRNTGAW